MAAAKPKLILRIRTALQDANPPDRDSMRLLILKDVAATMQQIEGNKL